MAQVRGIADLGIFHVQGQPNLNVKVDRKKAARYGLNTGDVNTIIQAAMGGAIATTLLESDRSWNVQVRLPPEYRQSLESVRNVKVGYSTPAGINAYVPLSELANITLDTGASFIYHESRERYIPVKFSVRDRDLGGAVGEAQERIAKNVQLPTGYRILWCEPTHAGRVRITVKNHLLLLARLPTAHLVLFCSAALRPSSAHRSLA
jgi:cobalt-zinc-cadmium resistance protein CzcA